MKRFSLSIISLILLVGCGHTQNHHNIANNHMHKKHHAELIKSFDDPARDEWQRPQHVLKLMGDIRGKTIIDIGSGSGYFTKYFLKSGANVVAADVDDKFLYHVKRSFTRDHSNLKTLKIAYDDPKMKAHGYDIAFTSNTYHHINNRAEYFKKVLHGLKVGGKVVILDFKKQADVERTFGPPENMRIDLSVVINELISAGFDNLEIINNEFLHQYFISAQRTR
jgi:predicted methyltransferase